MRRDTYRLHFQISRCNKQFPRQKKRTRARISYFNYISYNIQWLIHALKIRLILVPRLLNEAVRRKTRENRTKYAANQHIAPRHHPRNRLFNELVPQTSIGFFREPSRANDPTSASDAIFKQHPRLDSIRDVRWVGKMLRLPWTTCRAVSKRAVFPRLGEFTSHRSNDTLLARTNDPPRPSKSPSTLRWRNNNASRYD